MNGLGWWSRSSAADAGARTGPGLPTALAVAFAVVLAAVAGVLALEAAGLPLPAVEEFLSGR